MGSTKVASSKPPAFTGADDLCRLFSEMTSVLEAELCPIGSVSLPVPACFSVDSFDPSKGKEFCVGLLQNPATHPWGDHVMRCSATSRMTVAGSLFLFRKALPVPSNGREAQEHRLRMCTDPHIPDLPAGYLSHCRRIARECFPPGWDRSYQDLAWRSVPSVSSCLENGRGKGGARATLPDRADFLRSCLREKSEVDISRDVNYFSVVGEGKVRGVTIASKTQWVLSPLHKALYNQLSRFPWLLRGEAKPCKLAGFRRVKGEVFVSGDYEAATDHLPLEVMEAMLKVALQNSSWIPSSLGRAALLSLRSRIHYEDCSVPFEQAVGQLMGNLLSFPFLCLQNYAAFRWVFPGTSVPVKINGDDIVFRSSREDFDRWSGFVARVGLRLSVGKTMVHSRFFTVNSSFFRAGDFSPRLVPVLRTGGLSRPLDTVGGLGGAFRSFLRGFRGLALERAESLFLRRRKRYILVSGRSVTRGLGIPASIPALCSAGLWRREQWFFDSLESEEPLPPDPSRLKWCPVPAGWRRVPLPEGRRVRAFARRVETSFWSQLTSDAWLSPPKVNTLRSAYFSQLSGSGYESSWRRWRGDRRKWMILCHPNSQLADRCFLKHGLQCPHLRRYRVTGEKARGFTPPGRVCRVWQPYDETEIVRAQFSC
jgi:hypothetical protein